MLIHLLVLQVRNPEKGFRQYGPPGVEAELERELADARARGEHTRTARDSSGSDVP